MIEVQIRNISTKGRFHHVTDVILQVLINIVLNT